MRLPILLTISAVLLVGACGDDSSSSPANGGGGQGAAGGVGGTGAQGGAAGAPLCGSANLPFDPTGLEEIAYDDGVAATHLREQDWSITGGTTYVINQESVHEAVRFDLPHPARVHAFQVRWADLPGGIDPAFELQAGLYPDFGYNGFDFWAPDPLWVGSRCAEDVDDSGEGWTTYVLDSPVEIAHPGLVYVAHRAEPGDPVWWFDGTVEGDPDNPCADFHECQSSLNLPEADTAQYFNGISFPFQYHFMVRLFVEYTDDVQPADKLFQQVAGAPSGGHVTWGDYDDDGWDDLLLGNKLWRNLGDGTFSDVSVAAGLDGIAGTGGVWGDFDNDGCLDLFLFAETYNAQDTLLHSNCDGTFDDVTVAAGFVDQQSYEDCGDPANTAAPTAAAAWVDIDSDGYLDVYLANFICWANESYYIDTVYMNDGDGTFTEVTGQNGFGGIGIPSRGVAPVDHDGDGDVDIFVNVYRLKQNRFYDNLGDGTVDEAGVDTGLAGHKDLLYYGHTIGAAWGDLDNDGDFDNVSANLAHPRFFDFSDKTQILLNDGSGHYSDNGGDWTYPESAAGLRYQETHSVPVLADIDQDGALDLVITAVYPGRPTDFYWGRGDGTFTLDAYHAGITTEDGWGLAVADFDNDGDMDLFASNLFENTLDDTAKGHWLQLRVVGVTANRAAIGATVRVSSGGQTWMRHVQGGSGKGGQDSLYLHFGLGDVSAIDEIRVTFPGGAESVYSGPIAVDQRLWLIQDDPSPVTSWGNPT